LIHQVASDFRWRPRGGAQASSFDHLLGAELAKQIKVRSVAKQRAGFGEFTLLADNRGARICACPAS
jgi:hypothetical protein